MRSDYMLYAVSAICFAIAIISIVALTAESYRTLSVVATVSFGIFFVGLGYFLRPKTKTSTTEITAPPPAVATETPIVAVPPPPTVPEIAAVDTVVTDTSVATAMEFIPLKLRLTKIRGIGEKRYGQLKALGIKNAKDLAETSPQELAAKLDIPTKTATRWIVDAKELAEKA